MKEFKFACPVCGQHITAASGTSGAQIECPTCFQRIVVPPERTDETKLIISAAKADRPRPPQTTIEQAAALPRPRKGLGATIAFFLVLGLIGVGAYVMRDRLGFLGGTGETSSTNKPIADAPPVAKSASQWTMNPAEARIPNEPVIGSLNGAPFSFTRATLQGGLLSIRQGKGWPPELAVAIQFPGKNGEDFAGKSIHVSPDQTPPVPKVVMRWKNEQGNSDTRSFASNYLLQLEFGALQNQTLGGEIYIALPDEKQSFLAGSFQAELRAPDAPKNKRKKLPPSVREPQTVQ